MLYLIHEVVSLKVNVSEMAVSEYVLFFGEVITMVGDVVSE